MQHRSFISWGRPCADPLDGISRRGSIFAAEFPLSDSKYDTNRWIWIGPHGHAVSAPYQSRGHAAERLLSAKSNAPATAADTARGCNYVNFVRPCHWGHVSGAMLLEPCFWGDVSRGAAIIWGSQFQCSRCNRTPRLLTGKQKRYLRGLGHNLKPVVMIGKQGLLDSVVSQLEANLLAHELIKIKILGSCSLDRDACASAIVEATGAELAQSLGRTQLYYRPHPENPELPLPAAR